MIKKKNGNERYEWTFESIEKWMKEGKIMNEGMNEWMNK